MHDRSNLPRPTAQGVLSALRQSPLGADHLTMASSLKAPSARNDSSALIPSAALPRTAPRGSARVVDATAFASFLDPQGAAGVVIEFGGMTRLYPFLRKVIEQSEQFLPPIASPLTERFLRGAKQWGPRSAARKDIPYSMRGLILQRVQDEPTRSPKTASEPKDGAVLSFRDVPTHRTALPARVAEYEKLLTSLGQEALRVVSEDEHLVFDSLGGVSGVAIAFLLSSSPRDDFLRLAFSETLSRAGFRPSTASTHIAETSWSGIRATSAAPPWDISRMIGYLR